MNTIGVCLQLKTSVTRGLILNLWKRTIMEESQNSKHSSRHYGLKKKKSFISEFLQKYYSWSSTLQQWWSVLEREIEREQTQWSWERCAVLMTEINHRHKRTCPGTMCCPSLVSPATELRLCTPDIVLSQLFLGGGQICCFYFHFFSRVCFILICV